MSASWLHDAVFYEIYPQSFFDSNGDGIGDIPGMIQKLPYTQSLGCNAIWVNPCFDSPFKDAGYDVRDYKKVAPRYGTNEDLIRFFEEAHRQGIHVLLDLVPGHTSEEHPWFRASAQEDPNEFSGRYIWTGSPFDAGDGMPFIGGESPRNGTYILNFFKCQPALNYGYRERRQPWQMPIDHPDCLATRQAMKDVMRFWLDRGCDGFRVDMAASLVKNDGEDKLGTMAVWQDILGAMHDEYPEAAFVSEWNKPKLALNCGFDMDFYLEWHGNGYSSLMRDYEGATDCQVRGPDGSYFAAASGSDVQRFLADYLPQYEATREKGQWCFITCNHDTLRPSANLTDLERKVCFAMLLTMPGAPFVYYGDEIGMRYLPLKTKEGGYFRTGSRTPMQWAPGKNLGFSDAPESALYLPVDGAPDAPTVAGQEADPNSMLHHVRGLLALRHRTPDLQNTSPFAVFSAEPGQRLFAYLRGSLLCAVNPGLSPATLALDKDRTPLYLFGQATVDGGTLTLGSQSFVILK